jgi:Ca2+-binding EF-hand superfamily protein
MALFDTDGNGNISFREFVVGMGMLASREGDPLSNFCFQLIDADRSGTVSRDVLLSIVWWGRIAILAVG